ncbi:DNA-binding SARP family transcriptional activator/tetratricopeptide (TPR) repeat protein [Nonomuraea thailandensis]|uniref:DNA-binding SARP family transcriptional activator/tetratricopeptide (TPR) repeat protein n=1 Tax=Nonomuraea thailandensis TaxID=1188745 RepID=A0A9X2GFG5_9ACTN|nr:BTAD domain-containing putative transcriptional regulator [Nonomuraea thailandensis]MCP2356494.1 DNA-binding SARP family transcriptional activator/tetratricopeptide (TPR) repeat protein [Nonomuraea thailandensis]
MEFRLLGPVGAWHAGRRLGPSTPQQRTVLAMLLLEPGRPVPVARLETALWASEPPGSARNAVQGHISRLRRLLAPFPEAALTTSARGYCLTTGCDRVDLHRFRELVRGAGGETDPERAAGLLRAALALWQGPPLTDVAGRWLPDVVLPGLEEERLAALERRAALDLRQGRHQEVAAELAPLVGEDPLRERLVTLLMTALSRGGHRTEALSVFRTVRRRFADELGLEPGEELQRLHQAILAGRDETAANGKTPAANGGTAAGSLAVPRHLPPDTEPFTAREDELAALDRLTAPRQEQAPPPCVVTGTGGVGKTTLAVHWAHRARDRFPDGQLYVNLQGYGPTHAARSPAEAVRLFLDALQVPPELIPATLEAQAGLYRSLLAGRRMLILLDNALDADQVRPLLPSAPGCLALITSRAELTGLVAAEGGRTLSLGLFSPAESRELLTRRLGVAKVGAEPQAVDDIVSRCAGLPLALSIVAARAQARPAFPLRALITGLEADGPDEPGSLDVFDGGDTGTNMRTVFSWSYRALSPEAARLFRLRGLLPAPELSASAAASLAGIAVREARRLLAELTRANLAAEPSPGRYGWHDLLRAYAEELTLLHDSEHERREALHRLLDHYLHSAHLGDGLLEMLHRVPLALAQPRPGVVVARIGDRAQSLAWFGREHRTLLAAIRHAARAGFDAHAWQLACACWGFLSQESRSDDQVAMYRIALEAALRLDDPAAQAHVRVGLAQALIRLGQDGTSGAHLRQALTLFRTLGDQVGQGVCLTYLSVLEDRRSRYAEGLELSEEALRLHRSAGDRAGEGRVLNNIGWFHARLGAYGQALRRCEEALLIHRELDDVAGESATLDSMGYIHHLLGQYEDAIAYYLRSLSWRGGKRALGARTLQRLGEAQVAAGRVAEGRRTLGRALDLVAELAPGDADALRARIHGLAPQGDS